MSKTGNCPENYCLAVYHGENIFVPKTYLVKALGLVFPLVCQCEK